MYSTIRLLFQGVEFPAVTSWVDWGRRGKQGTRRRHVLTYLGRVEFNKRIY